MLRGGGGEVEGASVEKLHVEIVLFGAFEIFLYVGSTDTQAPQVPGGGIRLR